MIRLKWVFIEEDENIFIFDEEKEYSEYLFKFMLVEFLMINIDKLFLMDKGVEEVFDFWGKRVEYDVFFE